MDDARQRYLPWLTLKALPFVSDRLGKKLIHAFGSPEALFFAAKPELQKIEGMTAKALGAILDHKKYLPQAQAILDQTMDKGYELTRFTDPHYPELLKEIPDPPMLLFSNGSLKDLDAAFPDRPCFAMVGARNATSYGRQVAQKLASQLSQAGFTIVSGMAAGIDTWAHKGALEAQGPTFAVLGSGLNHIYPAGNKDLFKAITQSGAAISEFFPEAPALPRHFPIRNRIIAGLCVGTLVVEAALKSGSLITARLTGEYNREVFAVPGSILSSRSRGTHFLIRQGAQLVETLDDILNGLGQFVHPQPGEPAESKKEKPVMDKVQALVYKHLDPYPRHMDMIINAIGMESHLITAALTEMEMSGLIRRHPGNLFSLSEE